MQSFPNYISRMTDRINAVTWHVRALLFGTVFFFVSLISTMPTEAGLGSWTVNDTLEDYGVFVMFLALWCGVYANFQRSISLTALLGLLAVALWAEDINLLNSIYKTVRYWFGHEITSSERQRGDVFLLGAVAVLLLLRFFQKGFKSFFRIHITAFLLFYTVFLLWIHYLLPYHLQQAILEPSLNYQNEFASTYEGRFKYQCDQGQWTCYSWLGDEIPNDLPKIEALHEVIRAHKDVRMNVEGMVETLNAESEDVFRGIDANKKVLVSYYKNHELNRVVLNSDLSMKAVDAITWPLLVFSTTFSIVWFFGGLHLVFMHQARFSGAKPKLTNRHQD